ncbi:MAG: DUF2807 domain-containing protein [Ignavibacteriales bacterium]|nr:DUF2807 domain-containing protein [Ignavibacteriales bacterium]
MKLKNLLSILAPFALLPILFIAGCTNHLSDPDQIVGSGKLTSEPRSLPAFTGIQVTGSAKIVIKQDTVQSLRIEADDNIMDRITTVVNNGLLVIGLQQGSYNNVTINVFASMKAIERLECVGTADFVTSGPLQSEGITCRVTGAGTMTLSGTATKQTIEVTGTGDVHNFGLVSTRCAATITGLGNLEVNVTQQLDAVVSGSGSIIYTGNPGVVNKTIVWIGSVKPKS